MFDNVIHFFFFFFVFCIFSSSHSKQKKKKKKQRESPKSTFLPNQTVSAIGLRLSKARFSQLTTSRAHAPPYYTYTTLSSREVDESSSSSSFSLSFCRLLHYERFLPFSFYLQACGKSWFRTSCIARLFFPPLFSFFKAKRRDIDDSH